MAGLGSITVTLGLNMQAFQRGLDTAERNLRSVADGMKATGEKMASAITVPLAGLGAVAMAGAVQVEGSQSLIQAQLGITEQRAGELQGVVNNLFKDGLGGDMTEVQNSVTTVVRNMKSLEGASDEMIQNVTKNSLNLSKAFEADTNDVSKSINSMQQAFGNISVDESFDLIANGFQNGLDYSGEFLDSVNEYSVHFQKMGFSADEMFAYFNAGAENGVFQLDKVGDLVKEFNIRLSDGTAGDVMHQLSGETQKLYKHFQKTGEGGQEVFQSITEDLRQMDDEQEAYKLGVALMGTQFEDLELDAVKALGEVIGTTSDATGAMDALNDSMNKDLGTVMTSAFREITMALAPLGIVIGQLIQEYLPPLLEKVEALSNWFTGLSSKNQMLIVSLGALAAVFPLILMAVGSMISAFASIAGAFSSVITIGGKIFSIFNKIRTVMNFATILPLITSPVGLIIGAIVALIAIGVAIWQNWDTIKAKAIEIWGAISTFAVEIWGSISNYFSETWNTISDGITGFLDKTGKWFSEKWESIKKTTSDVFNQIIDFLVKWAIKIFNVTPIGMFVNLITDNWDFIRDTTKIVFEMIRDIILAIWNKIKEKVSPIIEAIVDFAVDTWNKLKEKTTEIFNAVKDFFVDTWNKIKEKVSPIIEAISKFVSDTWTKIKTKTTEIFNAVKEFLTTVWNAIVNFITPIVTKIFNAVKSAWDKVSSTTSSVFETVKSFISTAWDKIYTTVSDFAGKVYTTVKGKFEDAKKAITEPIEDAKNTIEKALDKIKGFFDNLKLKIPMPSIPKFSVSAGTTTFLGQEITVPKFDVTWNAKGNIFNGATVLGGGQGVGEAGAEAVLPIQHKRYMRPFSSSIASHLADMTKDKTSGGITQHITINSPEPLSPSDIARKQLQASRKLAMEWG